MFRVALTTIVVLFALLNAMMGNVVVAVGCAICLWLAYRK